MTNQNPAGGSATVTVTWNGAESDIDIALTGRRTIADLRRLAIEEFGIGDHGAQRLGLFAHGGLGLWDDQPVEIVDPGDLLVLRPRVVGA